MPQRRRHQPDLLLMREVRIHVKSQDGFPLIHSNIAAYLGAAKIGEVKDSEGQATFGFDGEGPVRVVVDYAGQGSIDRTFATGEDAIRIDFRGVILGDKWMTFLKEYFPALLGFVMLIIALALAFTFKNSTPAQDLLLRITMSLAAGGIATVITGSVGLTVDLGPKLGVTAAGALAVLAMTYLVHPDIIIHDDVRTIVPGDNNTAPATDGTGAAGNMD